MTGGVVCATTTPAPAIITRRIIGTATATDVTRGIISTTRLADVARSIISTAALTDVANGIIRTTAGKCRGRGRNSRNCSQD